MTITLNSSVIETHNISPAAVELMLFLQQTQSKKTAFVKAIDELESRGFILIEDEYPKLTPGGKKELNSILLDSNSADIGEEFFSNLDKLVEDLQACYPSGKKAGTNAFWRGNKSDVKKKVQSFFVRYGDVWSAEELIAATKAYVDGFNGNYQFMRILPYFIWKQENKDGTLVTSSDLATFCENISQNVDVRQDWTSQMI